MARSRQTSVEPPPGTMPSFIADLTELSASSYLVRVRVRVRRLGVRVRVGVRVGGLGLGLGLGLGVERVRIPQLLVLELRLGRGAHLDPPDGAAELVRVRARVRVRAGVRIRVIVRVRVLVRLDPNQDHLRDALLTLLAVELRVGRLLLRLARVRV